tara:strand:- start:477 stop:743 length:267 start_codon:yes stop_codon:yes gene_type:complete
MSDWYDPDSRNQLEPQQEEEWEGNWCTTLFSFIFFFGGFLILGYLFPQTVDSIETFLEKSISEIITKTGAFLHATKEVLKPIDTALSQ